MRARMTRPHSASWSSEDRFLTQAQSEALFQRIRSFARQESEVLPELTSWWSGELRWGRNQVTLASDRRDTHVLVKPRIRSRRGVEGNSLQTNQLDDASLKALVRTVEDSTWGSDAPPVDTLPYEPPRPVLPMPEPAI